MYAWLECVPNGIAISPLFQGILLQLVAGNTNANAPISPVEFLRLPHFADTFCLVFPGLLEPPQAAVLPHVFLGGLVQDIGYREVQQILQHNQTFVESLDWINQKQKQKQASAVSGVVTSSSLVVVVSELDCRVASICICLCVGRLALGIGYLAFGHLALGIWHLALGIWHLAFGIWHLAFGISKLLSGVGCLLLLLTTTKSRRVAVNEGQ